MKRALALIYLVCSCWAARAQHNLIPNPGFEQLNGSKINSWYFWGTVDIFQTGQWISKGSSKDSPKEAEAKEGQICLGIGASPAKTEVAYCKLQAPLQAGQVYEISVWVLSPSIRPCKPVDKITCFVSDSMLNDFDHKTGSSQTVEALILQSSTKQILSNEQEWVEVKAQFQAEGGERLLFVGNFVGFNTEFIGRAQPGSTETSRDFYYYFDSFKLEAKTVQAGDMIVEHDILFAKGKDQINPNSEQVLERILLVMQQQKNIKLEVVGHTDSDGSASENEALSLARANSIKRWLVTKGISANRIKTSGKGSREPIADNLSEAGKKLNRRVALVF